VGWWSEWAVEVQLSLWGRMRQNTFACNSTRRKSSPMDQYQRMIKNAVLAVWKYCLLSESYAAISLILPRHSEPPLKFHSESVSLVEYEA
jgi:hypothetical protein